VGCASGPNADVADVELELTFLRTDSLMWEAARALSDADSSQHAAIFEQHLGRDRDFLAQFIGLNRLAQRLRLSPEGADSLLIAEYCRVLSDSAMLALLDTVRQVFPYSQPLMADLTPPLKRLQVAFPEIELPAFRAHVSGYLPAQGMRQVDQVVPLPNYFSLGLHYFLGPDFSYYPPTLPQYIRTRFDPAYLEVMAMREIAEGMVAPLPRGRETTFLDEAIREGIKQYFLHQMLPHTSDSLRLLYSSEQMEWAHFYEKRIYKELMDDLFSTDFEVKREYLNDKPYTTSLSLESAPRLGEYLGWRVVEAFMARNDNLPLSELCERQDYEVIFRNSQYRPE